MSLQPPPTANIGDVWVDPITADRYIFTGENLEAVNYGWVRWSLASEQAAFERDDAPTSGGESVTTESEKDSS